MQYRKLGTTGVSVSELCLGTMMLLEDNLGAAGWSLTAEDEKQIDALVPRGEHTGKGYNDPQYPVRGRVVD